MTGVQKCALPIYERKYVYKYSETELDNTRVLDESLKEVKEDKVRKEEDMKIQEKKESQKQNKILIILASIFTGLVVLTAAIVFLLPHLTEEKPIEIPDVSNLSAKDASNKLTKEGFSVSCGEEEYKYVASDDVKAEYAVKTSPEAGTLVKPGKRVCIYLSSGDASFEMEDYIGKNYIEVKTILETKYGCNVMVEKQKVKEEDNKEADTVIDTNPKVGETVKNGSSITLFIPEVEVVYPDFTSGYTLEQVEEFAKKYNLTLIVNYQENNALAPGTITNQSRPAGSVVMEGVNLVITVLKLPEAVEGVILPDED